MTNKEIAGKFDLFADLMAYNGESEQRTKSYSYAYQAIRNAEGEVFAMTLPELKAIKGVGDAISKKIMEIQASGSFKELDNYLKVTPPMVLQMRRLKGLGMGKIKDIETQLMPQSLGELAYACQENRLVSLKGFGLKIQQKLLEQISFLESQSGKFYMPQLLATSKSLTTELNKVLADSVAWCFVGDLVRLMPTPTSLEVLFLSEAFDFSEVATLFTDYTLHPSEGGATGVFQGAIPVKLYRHSADSCGLRLVELNSEAAYFQKLEAAHPQIKALTNCKTEEAVFEALGLPFCSPWLRETTYQHNVLPQSSDLQLADIKGVIHAHSNWSDGSVSLDELAAYCRKSGFEYLLITEHSKSAFYANGLTEERVWEQWVLIEALNVKNPKFRILKGIECDILYDGSLDYPDELLAEFDLVIASVHSTLNMSPEKAKARLLKAISNKHVHILGHATGRILLSREGYLGDLTEVIDACAAHQVAIEINANPLRLDLDYTWIPYALSKGVFLSINPDAHTPKGIHDLEYGVLMARKGGLPVSKNLSSMTCSELLAWKMAKNKN
jgi:DNA polymerase (family 10)